MSENPYRRQIAAAEIFSLAWLRILFRAVWLFFPSLIFIVLSLFAFWNLTQGKDVLQRTLENSRIFYTFIIAQVFWVYITWYSSRIISKIKYAALPDDPGKEEHHWGRFLIQMPRFLAFSCLTVIILAFLKYRYDPSGKLGWLFNLLMAASVFYYMVMYAYWGRMADKADNFDDKADKIKYLDSFRYTTYALLGAALLVIIFFQSFLFLVLFLVAIQAGLVLLLVFRRKRIFVDEPNRNYKLVASDRILKRVMEYTSDKEDRGYTKIFIGILVIGMGFYISTIFSVRFSVYIGAFPFILFAFGILLILGNGVTLLSVIKRINFHIILFSFAFLVGLLLEPHYAHIPEKKNTAMRFDQRQNVNEYFKNWVSQRRKELDDTTNKNIYPVYFVLSDGGASRSGYWGASVLAKLNQETNDKFSQHLFCLSGASGGSVGNATYFNLLRAKQNSDTIKNELLAVQDYLETDFLTFTIARMLGPDVFRHILPLKFIDDRAAALAHVLEKGSGKSSLLYDSMATSFSEIITQKEKPYSLPILCINTTRMQDGLPAVISNIDLSDQRFNKRLDFLDLPGEEKDIRLSTAVVLGASFPYVSPAGRVDAGDKPEYFVDGGYFDNSGSGVVSEMISILLKDPLYLEYKNKLQFYILHIANSPDGEAELKKINPLVNDLAAPVKTLIGAYGTQTVVNDERLRNLMKTTYNDALHYRKINLYDDGKNITYSMNWVISDHLLAAMKESLDYNSELKKLVTEIKKQ